MSISRILTSLQDGHRSWCVTSPENKWRMEPQFGYLSNSEKISAYLKKLNWRHEGRRGENIKGRALRELIIAHTSLQNYPDMLELLKPALITSHSSVCEAFLTAQCPTEDSRLSVLFGQWEKKKVGWPQFSQTHKGPWTVVKRCICCDF